jgi:hypothetical protein
MLLQILLKIKIKNLNLIIKNFKRIKKYYKINLNKLSNLIDNPQLKLYKFKDK